LKQPRTISFNKDQLCRSLTIGRISIYLQCDAPKEQDLEKYRSEWDRLMLISGKNPKSEEDQNWMEELIFCTIFLEECDDMEDAKERMAFWCDNIRLNGPIYACLYQDGDALQENLEVEESPEQKQNST
jgi:hypothetical protein